jgi:hypothetical protein
LLAVTGGLLEAKEKAFLASKKLLAVYLKTQVISHVKKA